MSLDPPKVLLERTFLDAVDNPKSPQHQRARATYLELVERYERDEVMLYAVSDQFRSWRAGHRLGRFAPVDMLQVGWQHRRDARRMSPDSAPSARVDLTRVSPYAHMFGVASVVLVAASVLPWFRAATGGRSIETPGLSLVSVALCVALVATVSAVTLAPAVRPRAPRLPPVAPALVGTAALLIVWLQFVGGSSHGTRTIGVTLALIAAGAVFAAGLLLGLHALGAIGHPKVPRSTHPQVDYELALVLVMCRRARVRRIATLDARIDQFGFETIELVEWFEAPAP